MLILVYACLPEVDLEEGQSYPIDPVFHPLQKILGYLLANALVPLLCVIFALALKQSISCILW